MPLIEYLGEPTARCRGCGGDYTADHLVDLHNGGEYMCKECYKEAHQNYLNIIEPLTEEERENLRNFWTSVAFQFEKETNRPGIPILDEYCWMHVDQPDGGGWCCAVCYREQQQEVKQP